MTMFTEWHIYHIYPTFPLKKILLELTEKTNFFKQMSYLTYSSNPSTVISLSCLYHISCHTTLGPFNPWKYPLLTLIFCAFPWISPPASPDKKVSLKNLILSHIHLKHPKPWSKRELSLIESLFWVCLVCDLDLSFLPLHATGSLWWK